jgi:hypothetical protein
MKTAKQLKKIAKLTNKLSFSFGDDQITNIIWNILYIIHSLTIEAAKNGEFDLIISKEKFANINYSSFDKQVIWNKVRSYLDKLGYGISANFFNKKDKNIQDFMLFWSR